MGAIAIVDDDVAVDRRGSRCEKRDWGVFCSVVNWFVSECPRFRASFGCFEASGVMVVVSIGDIDVAV
jgi:hypothetical protein